MHPPGGDVEDDDEGDEVGGGDEADDENDGGDEMMGANEGDDEVVEEEDVDEAMSGHTKRCPHTRRRAYTALPPFKAILRMPP